MAKLRVIVSALFIALLIASPVGAFDSKNKGLSITPLRKEVTVAAGKDDYNAFTVSNLTDQPMVIKLSVNQFSVSDYAYEYNFKQPANDWVKLAFTQAELKPRETKQIPYNIIIPAGTAPGGHYYTLFASTDVKGSDLPSTVQAATLLYIIVDGKLLRTSIIRNDSISWIAMGQTIPYKFDVENLGNVHFSGYFFGQLETPFGKLPENGSAHLLMPGAPRTIESSIPSPLLPGIYKVTYGYRVDFAEFIISKSNYVLFIPPWSIIAAIFLGLIARWQWQQRKVNK